MQYALIFLALLSNFWAAVPADPQPRVNYTFLVDGAPLNERAGAPVSLKTLRLQSKLDENSERLFPELKGQPVVGNGTVSLARGNRRFAALKWDLSEPLSDFLGEATSGDRMVIEFNEIGIRQKDGKLRKLSDGSTAIYNIPLY
jgi:hypothetical protein